MNIWRIIVRNLFYYRRVNLAVILGVAAATAVLTGALLVGDSMRYSLRKVSLDRLAKIDELLLTEQFFRQELAEEISKSEAFQDNYQLAIPALVFPQASVQAGQGDESPLATDVFLIASTDAFWELDNGEATPTRKPTGREIVINEQLARDLGIDPDDVKGGQAPEITLRLPKPQSIHADSALGKKQDIVLPIAGLRVIDVVPNQGVARFGLSPSQTVTANAFLPLDLLQDQINQARAPRRPRRRAELDNFKPTLVERPVNAIFLSSNSSSPPAADVTARLQEELRPKLADYGLSLEQIQLTYTPEEAAEPIVAHQYYSLSSREMMLTPEVEQAALTAFQGLQAKEALTYLANEMSIVKNGDVVTEEPIPFSTITAIDFVDDFRPESAVTDEPAKSLSETGIALNEWAANDLGAEVGDTIRVLYYDPETTDTEPVEQSIDLVLEDILKFTTREMEGGQLSQPLPFRSPPHWINDPDLTPYVPGFSDAESISQPDVLPFPTLDRMRKSGEDDEYWYRYRTTPKAFVSLELGERLWGSRFGNATMVRVPDQESLSIDELQSRLQKALDDVTAEAGFAINPIKRTWLKASSGTTPFDVLFLSLSMFIIVSAVILIALLFRLGIEQRSEQVGTLLALGFTRRKVAKLLLLEGVLISLVGGLLGVGIGVAYGELMILGLTTWWVGAIVTPFLEFHASGLSLAAGFMAGALVSLLTILVTLWLARGESIRRMLSGRWGESGSSIGVVGRVFDVLVAIGILMAVALAGWATQLGGEAQAGAFVGAGCLLLGSLLAATWKRLKTSGSEEAVAKGKKFSLAGMSLSNVGRNAGRSTLTIGLVAVASFLIVAISAFHAEPTSQGTGGFDYIVQTNLPVFENLSLGSGREELFGEEARQLDGTTILPFRFKGGDNASCNNPYQSSQPRILGMTKQTAEYFDEEKSSSFAWAGSTATTPKQESNPWHLLFVPLEDSTDEEPIVPVVIDKNTAMYSLQVYSVGSEFEMTYDESKTIRFRVVGFLSNTILQGSLIIADDRLKDLFPDVAGYRYFLVDVPQMSTGNLSEETERRGKPVLEAMRKQLGDQGFSAVSTQDVLSQLLAVQNTYLSTFQSLGALGLLFGTFGLGTVQLRNVLERRQELALMRAEGFARSRLAAMLLMENANVLIRGLGIGLLAALFAVLPHMYFGEASVPWVYLLGMIGVIAVVGFATSGFAIRVLFAEPLLKSLRED